MDNRNIYQQPNPQNGFYSYSYPAATSSYMRPDPVSYLLPQAAPAALKGRPVSSFEEARVSPVDLDGSITFFPDVGNKKIYTKRINADGTAALQTYVLDEKVVEVSHNEPVTREEFNELKKALETLVTQLS